MGISYWEDDTVFQREKKQKTVKRELTEAELAKVSGGTSTIIIRLRLDRKRRRNRFG